MYGFGVCFRGRGVHNVGDGFRVWSVERGARVCSLARRGWGSRLGV